MTKLTPIQTKAIKLNSGLHLLSYIESIDKENPPIASISVTPGQIGSRVAMLFSDADNEGVLDKPESKAVIRVTGKPVELIVSIYINATCKSPEVTLKVENLLQKDTGSSVLDKNTESKLPKSPLAFSGHVQWQGDVQLKPGEALGNPDKNWRIEGFAIHWPEKKQGVDIEYSCVVNTLGETPKSKLGGVVGTKARALAITALSAQLVGPNAAQYELVFQVVFSETGLRTITCDGQKISAIHNNEFLTGLRGFVKQKSTINDTQSSVNS